jgi:pilus assembly protein CpaD
MLIPAGSRNEAAARRVAYDIANTLQVKGVSERQIVVQHYQAKGYGEAATIRLVFGDLKAKVATPCGQWDEDIVETSENRNYYNFGCAAQQNLAAMIENPNDLLRPRGVTAIDPQRRSTVIGDWQEDGSGALEPLFDD